MKIFSQLVCCVIKWYLFRIQPLRFHCWVWFAVWCRWAGLGLEVKLQDLCHNCTPLKIHFFPKNLRCNLTYYEGENFSDSSFHHIFESENSLTWGVKCEKLNFRKILGNLLDELWILYMNGTVIYKFLAVLK